MQGKRRRAQGQRAALQWMGAHSNKSKQLSRDLGNKTNEILKHDIHYDIFVLLNRKNLLANKLRFT